MNSRVSITAWFTVAAVLAAAAVPASAEPFRLDPTVGMGGILRPVVAGPADVSFEGIVARSDGTYVVLRRRVRTGRNDVIRLYRVRADGRMIAALGHGLSVPRNATRWHLAAAGDGSLVAWATQDSASGAETMRIRAVASFDRRGAARPAFAQGGLMTSVPHQPQPLPSGELPVADPQPVIGRWVLPLADSVLVLGTRELSGGGFGPRLMKVDMRGKLVGSFGAGAGYVDVTPPTSLLTSARGAGVGRWGGRFVVSVCGTREGRPAGAVLALGSGGAPDMSVGSAGWVGTQVCGVPGAVGSSSVLLASGVGAERFNLVTGRQAWLRGEAGSVGGDGGGCAPCPQAVLVNQGEVLVALRSVTVRVVTPVGDGEQRFEPGPAFLSRVDRAGAIFRSAAFRPFVSGAEADPEGRPSFQLMAVSARTRRRAVAVGWHRDPSSGRIRPVFVGLRRG